MDERILFYSLAGFAGGLYLFWRGFYWLKQKNAIENTPTSKVRGLAMGIAEVYGKVVPASEVLKSPFSGKDCVYYRYSIEEYRSSGKSRYWHTVDAGKGLTHFFIQDQTGKVLVDPQGAEIDIPLDYESKSGFGKDPSAIVRRFLKAREKSFEGLFMNKTMRYREHFIAPGDKLYVLGTASDNPFVEEATGKENSDVMMQKGQNIFYISDSHEKDILNRFAWKVWGGLLGGAALMVACLAIILAYLNVL